MKQKLLTLLFFMVSAVFFCVGASAASIDYDEAYRDIRHYHAGQSVVVESSIDVTISDVEAGHEYWFYCNPSSFSFHYYDSTNNATQYGTVEWRFATLGVQTSTPGCYTAIDNDNRIYLVSDFNQSSVTLTVSFSIDITDRSTASSILNSVYCSATYGYWCSSIGDNGIQSTQYLSLLNSIQQLSGDLSKETLPRFLGDNALVYFDETYFQRVSAYNNVGSVSFNDDGSIQSNGAYQIWLESSNNTPVIFLEKGYYYVIYSWSQSVPNGMLPYIDFSGIDSSNYSLTSRVVYNYGNRYVIFGVHVLNPFSTSSIRLGYSASAGNFSGVFYGGIVRASLDDQMSSAMSDEFIEKTDELTSAGEQQAQQEEETWNNINAYKDEISFDVDWTDAASGLTYVTGIFMDIWNNSPTEVITLSLMLGIAMLGIGRGVQAAIRVSRRRGDD